MALVAASQGGWVNIPDPRYGHFWEDPDWIYCGSPGEETLNSRDSRRGRGGWTYHAPEKKWVHGSHFSMSLVDMFSLRFLRRRDHPPPFPHNPPPGWTYSWPPDNPRSHSRLDMSASTATTEPTNQMLLEDTRSEVSATTVTPSESISVADDPRRRSRHRRHSSRR